MADIDEGKVRAEFAKLWQHRKQPKVRGRLCTQRDYAEDFYLARARHDAAEIEALKARIAKLEARGGKWVNIVFDGAPWSGSGRFVGIENASGNPINFDECIHTVNGYWVLRIYPPWQLQPAPEQKP